MRVSWFHTTTAVCVHLIPRLVWTCFVKSRRKWRKVSSHNNYISVHHSSSQGFISSERICRIVIDIIISFRGYGYASIKKPLHPTVAHRWVFPLLVWLHTIHNFISPYYGTQNQIYEKVAVYKYDLMLIYSHRRVWKFNSFSRYFLWWIILAGSY